MSRSKADAVRISECAAPQFGIDEQIGLLTRPISVDERLLQLMGRDVSTAICVDGREPLPKGGRLCGDDEYIAAARQYVTETLTTAEDQSQEVVQREARALRSLQVDILTEGELDEGRFYVWMSLAHHHHHHRSLRLEEHRIRLEARVHRRSCKTFQ